MPRGNVDYQKGLIYTIKTGDSLYVGSTTDFRDRKYKHKNEIVSERKKERRLYKTIINNGGEWEMKPYKIFPCNSKMELEIEEEKIRRELNADLNMNKAHSTLQDEINKKKNWAINNKEYYANRYNKLKTTCYCECGWSGTEYRLNAHKKSKKHQDFILSNNTE